MKVTLHDKTFELTIPARDIDKVVEGIAEKMNNDLAGKKPLFLCVLNGSFMFASDLMKNITVADSEISFVKLSSYQGTESNGKIKQLIGINENINGRTVVILEDIVDTGITMAGLRKQVEELKAKEVFVATLFFKPEALTNEVKLDYVGMEIPNDFIVGRGLDYDGLGRNYPDLYTLVEE